MASLRERLESKTRRRTVQPVQLATATQAEVDLVSDLTVLVVEQGREPTPDELAPLVALREARHVDVGFAALDSDVWEKVAATHPAPEGEDRGLDWRKALPVVAALCCEDESMQDDEAWAQVLATWSHGEKVALWGALLSINAEAPQAHLPKG
jgi:hypothetical protein